jgi:hypothetical protein
MKKLAVLCGVLALGVAAPAAAQDEEAKNAFGFVAGYNSVKIAKLPGGESTGGLSIGGIYERNLGAFGALRIEPKYTQKGSKVTVVVGSSSVTEDIDLAYLDIPIMLRTVYFKSKEWKVKPVIMAGVGPSFRLSAKFAGEDIKDGVKSLEWGLISVIGITGKAGKGEFTLGAQVSTSLNNIFENDPGDDTTYKNVGIGASFSLTFPIGQ